MILSAGKYPVAPTATMATIKCNTEELKIRESNAYDTLFNNTLDEYEESMRERFDLEAISEEYLAECREFEVNTIDKTEYEAIEAMGANCNALAVSRMIMGMLEAVVDFNPELDAGELTNLGKLYSTWRYVITMDVEWEGV